MNCPHIEEGTCNRGCRGFQCRRRDEQASAKQLGLSDKDIADLVATADYLQNDGSMSETDVLRRAALLRRIAAGGAQ